MKKFLFIGALALAVAAFLQQHVYAWKCANFSVGLNWSYQSGGNNLLWGLYRNGQPGGCDLPNCPVFNYAMQHGYQPNGGGYGYPSFGNDHGFEGSFPASAPYMPPTGAPFKAPAPTPVPGSQAYWYGQPVFQAVNYAPALSDSYYTPGNWYDR
jgi:hypothetical protein